MNKWHNHFLEIALLHAKLSKDPSTKVGAVIVGKDRELIGAGFNGFPRGIEDTPERLNDRETKLRLIVHAEMNALLAGAKLGIPVQGCTMYIAATDKSGEIWGGPPCPRCFVHIIQAGITSIITHERKSVPTKWEDDLNYSMELIKEVGIKYEEIKRC